MTVTITKNSNTHAGEYRAEVADSEHVGRLTWKAQGDNVRIADHTLVPQEIGGRGIAAQLVKALMADARTEGFRVVPQCSYVEAQFRRNPEWSDLRA